MWIARSKPGVLSAHEAPRRSSPRCLAKERKIRTGEVSTSAKLSMIDAVMTMAPGIVRVVGVKFDEGAVVAGRSVVREQTERDDQTRGRPRHDMNSLSQGTRPKSAAIFGSGGAIGPSC